MVLNPGETMVKTISTDSEVYRQNLEFWQRAWNMVKVPYTQLPDLNYIPRIPAELESKKTTRILDLGCGSGWLSVFLARNGFKMLGVDVASHAIELAKTWAVRTVNDENDSARTRQLGDVLDRHHHSRPSGDVTDE